MKVIVWLMLAAFAIGGCFFLCAGVHSLVTAVRRRPHLRRVIGVVTTVEKTREMRMDPSSSGRMRTYVTFFPVIQFTTEAGKSVRFRSELDASYPCFQQADGTEREPVSRYRDGQEIEVLYDPAGTFSPCIASWSGLYGVGTAMVVGGVAFLGASALMWVGFGPKLLGR